MRILFGSCPKRDGINSPVVGRLVPDSSIEDFNGNEAILSVIYDLQSSVATNDIRTVGVVRVSEDCRDGVYELSCPSITLSELPKECEGKIALLDPTAQKLYVSPDIVTVNRYTPLLCASCGTDVRHPLFLPNGKRVSISVISEDVHQLQNGADGCFILPATLQKSEDELFLLYRDIAEKAVGHPITVALSADEYLTTCLRALMRGAVWGEISLSFCDILTEEELKVALDRFHKAFCELEAEGREFNGYLLRTMIIDTPYLLFSADSLFGIDGFVYDAERLAALLSGERQQLPFELFETLISHMLRLTDSRPQLRHTVILGERTLNSKFCQALLDCGISDYAVLQDNFEELYNILSIALQ